MFFAKYSINKNYRYFLYLVNCSKIGLKCYIYITNKNKILIIKSSLWDKNFIIKDNFLTKKDKDYTLNYIKNVNLSEFHSKAGCFPIQVCLDNRIPEDVRGEFQRIAEKYKAKLIKDLELISPEKLHLYDYCKFKIVISPPGFREEVHIDNFSKLLTAVIFLSPDKNYGTFLHESNKDKNPKEIEWEVNRCAIMGNKYNKSWHSYGSHKDKYRFVAIISLHTNRIYSHMFVDLNITNFILFSFQRFLQHGIYFNIRQYLGKLKRYIFYIFKNIFS